MRFSSRALKALKRAKRWLQGAQRGFEDKRWDDCVYCSQMAAEQSLKGLLILLGVSFKRIHDISDYVLSLQKNAKLSNEFRTEIPQIADQLAELTEQRNLAGYGFEDDLDNEYFTSYAPEALKIGTRILQQVEKEMNQLLQKVKTSEEE